MGKKNITNELVLVPNFNLNFNFEFLTKFAPKENFQSKKRKNRTCACVHGRYLHIKIFHTGADRHNGILMSLLLLATETKVLKMKERKEKQPQKRHYTL